MSFNATGEYLKHRRNELGLTQQEVSLEVGDLHSQFVSNWERGLCLPPEWAWPKLNKVLKLHPLLIRSHLRTDYAEKADEYVKRVLKVKTLK